MKLTELQIQQLYSFTQKHYVDWYDVQTELVDHLANGIENELEENPSTTFESALNSEFKKFGIMGFNDVIEEKTKALNSYYRKLVLKNFLNFFKLPKIILTSFLAWVFYLGLHNVENRLFILIPAFVILFILPLHYFAVRINSVEKIKKQTGRKWLFDNTSLQLGGLNSVLNIGIYGSIIFDSKLQWSSKQEIICSLLIVALGLTLYLSIYIVSPKLRKEMAKQHPEYKFV
ncbi:MAG: hypothetical protein NWP87_01700 [Winogradskyella sp.]|nr:hypothetical protein [Winogradskyella sp.]